MHRLHIKETISSIVAMLYRDHDFKITVEKSKRFKSLTNQTAMLDTSIVGSSVASPKCGGRQKNWGEQNV